MDLTENSSVLGMHFNTGSKAKTVGCMRSAISSKKSHQCQSEILPEMVDLHGSSVKVHH